MNKLFMIFLFIVVSTRAYADLDDKDKSSIVDIVELPSELIFMAPVCPNESRMVGYPEALHSSARKRMQSLTSSYPWGFFGILDGRFESGNYGSIVRPASRASSLSYNNSFCVSTMKNFPGKGTLTFSNLFVESVFTGNSNKFCVIFTDNKNHSIGGCTGDSSTGVYYRESNESFRKMMTTGYLSRSLFEVILDTSQQHYDLTSATFRVFTIKSIEGCENEKCII